MAGATAWTAWIAVDTLYANTRNNPIEDIESASAAARRALRAARGRCGAGRWRGGLGSIRRVRFLAPGGASVESEGHKYPPKGVFGGADGTPSELVRKRANGEEIHLPSKLPYHAFGAGDFITAIRACGGGYGNPLERDPKDVLDDVLDEYITADQALEQYKVKIADGKVDAAATRAARANAR